MNEPVEYQYRTRPDWIPEWNGWNTCSKESAEAYEKTPYLHDWHYEVRRLYTSPPAQRKPLPCETLRELWCDASLSNSGSGWFVVSEAFARAIEAAHGIREKNT